MRKIALLLSLLVLVLGGAALAQEDGQDGPAQEGQGQDGAAGDVVEIRMITDGSEYYFDPVGVAVEPGTTIRFVNESGTHGTTSYSSDNGKPQRIPEGAASWNSPIFSEAGATFEVTLEQEGVYDYFCPPHEALGMVGRIVVGSADASPAQDASQLNFPAAAEALPSVDAITGQDDGTLSYQEQQSGS